MTQDNATTGTAAALECPVNTVDERAARIVAGLTVTLALLSLVPGAWWLVAVLAADFAVRAWVNRRYSPLRWAAKRVARAAGLEPKPVYAPPKRFAARIGSVLTLVALAAHLGGAHTAAVVVTAMLVVAASLEAFAGFCIACWLYPFVHRSTPA
ncbi:MAG TPA: DUF4395 domain-containing protein [Coriobacteriia bacterium]|nr:DUF4395 domain-containing protein [Coriobacteriia bacterium]